MLFIEVLRTSVRRRGRKKAHAVSFPERSVPVSGWSLNGQSAFTPVPTYSLLAPKRKKTPNF